MSSNQMDAVLFANNPEFHATWEGIQRKLGTVLSAAHDKTTDRERFELVIDAAISDLRDLRKLVATPLAQAATKIEILVEGPDPDGYWFARAEQLAHAIEAFGLTTRAQVVHLASMLGLGTGAGGCHVWVGSLDADSPRRALLITGTGPDWE